jgi:hypothetical protein
MVYSTRQQFTWIAQSWRRAEQSTSNSICCWHTCRSDTESVRRDQVNQYLILYMRWTSPVSCFPRSNMTGNYSTPRSQLAAIATNQRTFAYKGSIAPRCTPHPEGQAVLHRAAHLHSSSVRSPLQAAAQMQADPKSSTAPACMAPID